MVYRSSQQCYQWNDILFLLMRGSPLFMVGMQLVQVMGAQYNNKL